MYVLVFFFLVFVWDLIFGEFFVKFYFVVWFGRIVGFIDFCYKRCFLVFDFIVGFFIVLVVIIFVFLFLIVLFYVFFFLNYFLVVYFFKSFFVIKSFYEYVLRMIMDDIEEKRRVVLMIVSRNIKVFDEVYLNFVVIESFVENLNDFVVVFFFYFFFFGF